MDIEYSIVFDPHKQNQKREHGDDSPERGIVKAAECTAF